MKQERNWLPNSRPTAREQFRALVRFDPKQKAVEYALEKKPPTEATELSASERDILDARETGQHTLQYQSRTIVIKALGEMQRLAPVRHDVDVEKVSLAGRIKDVKFAHAEDVFRHFCDELERQAQWNAFRHENGLVREARYSRNHLLSGVSLFALVAPEVAVSSLMLKELVASGYLGGAALAATSGILTVTSGWLGGAFGVRQLRHIKRWRKAAGVLVIAISLAAGLVLQLALAHTREAIEHGSREVAIVKLLAILTRPSSWLDFSALSPLVLLLFGTLIFVLSVLKGGGGQGSFFDPYPGYERVDAPFQDTKDARLDSENNYRLGIVDAYADYRAEFVKQIAAGAAKVAEARLVLRQTTRDLAEVGARAREWDAEALHALREFRTTNASVRAHGEPPAYFATMPEFDDPTKALETTEELSALIAKFEAIQSKNEELAPRVEEAIVRAQDQAVRTVPVELKDIAIRAQVRRASEDQFSNGEAEPPDPGAANGSH